MIQAALLALSLSLLAPCAAVAARHGAPVLSLSAHSLDGPQSGPAEHASLESPAPQTDFHNIPPAAQSFKNESIVKPGDVIDVDVHYPVFGKATIDRDISLWAHRVVDTFTKGLGGEHIDPRQSRNELKAGYTVSYASPRSLSVTYEIWTYSDGIHGNNDIITLSYDMESGQRLLFEDLVADADTALERLAVYCSKTLSDTLGEDLDEIILKSGTAPDLDNYASFSLFPTGLRIHFQPYQVAPFVAGAQQVDVPLEVILDAGPHLELWGRQGR
jgi:hypothetical protein